MSAEQIVTYVEEEYDYAVERRHHIHQNPELSFKEYETTDYIENCMKDWGIDYNRLKSGTGLVAVLEGATSGKTVALRADIDALPMPEETDIPFKSKNEGIMHACGHDMHTATLLGLAHILSQHKEMIRGRVKFIFQPAEELFPGGAREVIAEGLVDDVDVIYGMHVKPALTYKEVSVHKGTIMAGSYVYKIKVVGKGGHGSNPSNTNDPVVAASAVVMALQTIVSRGIYPGTPLVLSTCMIHGGTKGNIIPDFVELEGQIRAFSKDVAMAAEQKIKEVSEGVCIGYGCKAEVLFEDGYDPLTNHDDNVELVDKALHEMSSASFKTLEPELGGEDFAYFMQKKPGAYFQVGIRSDEEAPVIPNHNTRFVADDRALATAMEAYLRILDKEFSL